MLKLDDSLGFMLNHAGRRVSYLLSLRLQTHGITTEQWKVLARLMEQDGINQKDLAQRAEKDQANITRILDQLERKELVERRANAVDRRSFLTYMTEKGRALTEILIPIEQAVVGSVLGNLTDEQTANLRALLIHITDNANTCIHEVEEKL